MWPTSRIKPCPPVSSYFSAQSRLAEDWLPVSQGQIHPSQPHLLRVETTTAARDVLHAAHETWYLMENPGNYSNLSPETKASTLPKPGMEPQH